MFRRSFLGLTVLAAVLVFFITGCAHQGTPRPATQRANSGVQITKTDGKLLIKVNGEEFTEYRYSGAPHVYFYPVIGPGGARMTRDYPMVRDSEGEEHDHPHHRSLWYSHGAVNGVDFWSEGSKAGKILHDKFLSIESGSASGLIKSRDNWGAGDGKVICTDERTFRLYARPDNERLLDFDVTIHA